jgi:hypothetical protein
LPRSLAAHLRLGQSLHAFNLPLASLYASCFLNYAFRT